VISAAGDIELLQTGRIMATAPPRVVAFTSPTSLSNWVKHPIWVGIWPSAFRFRFSAILIVITVSFSSSSSDDLSSRCLSVECAILRRAIMPPVYDSYALPPGLEELPKWKWNDRFDMPRGRFTSLHSPLGQLLILQILSASVKRASTPNGPTMQRSPSRLSSTTKRARSTRC
jgi:hypothetical protein